MNVPLPRIAVDLSPRALLASGVSGALAADMTAAQEGMWTLARDAGDLSPAAVRSDSSAPSVSVVRVLGPLEQRSTMHDPCGGITDGYDSIEARFRKAVDASKGAGGRVVMVIDSPGGVMAGGFPAIRRMRAYAQKAGVKVDTVAENTAASMGYALMLVGDRLHVPPDGRTASIGTVILRQQDSEAASVEVFRSGERKMRPNSLEALDDVDRAQIQEIVDSGAQDFAALVAEYRGKSAEHWLSLKGASLSGKAALEAGLVDSTRNAHEVIEMALSDAARAEMAEAMGLSATASEADIKARIQEHAKAASDLATVRAQLARVEADKLALEERQAREKAEIEKANKRAAFALEVEKACTDGFITPPRVVGLLSHYDAHGDASARATLAIVRADKPLVSTAKVGSAPDTSDAGAALTEAQKAHAKALGVDPSIYAAHIAGGPKGGV